MYVADSREFEIRLATSSLVQYGFSQRQTQLLYLDLISDKITR